MNKSTRHTKLWIKYIEFLQEFLQKRVKIEENDDKFLDFTLICWHYS